MILSLLHHVYDGRHETSREDYAAGWSKSVVVDAPEVTEAMESALRRQVVPHVVDSHRLPTSWRHVDWNAWAAVTDLHRAGRHDDALSLARLLHWCDSRFNGRDEGAWEITRNAEANR